MLRKLLGCRDMEINDVLYALWIVLPAYVANGAPLVVAKILDKIGVKRHPIDFGKVFIDGRRVFGENKTWEGLFFGVLAGVLTSVLQFYFENMFLVVVRGSVLSAGSMVGDLVGAFIKRRIGLKPGDPLPIVDQLMFVLIAIALCTPLNLISISVSQFVFILIATLLLHLLTNYVAFKLGLKSVPW